MGGKLPEADRRARLLLDTGRFEEARQHFDDLIAATPNWVDEQWDRPTVLVHRALLAWRLGRIPLALELAAEGWTDLDAERPSDAPSAHTLSLLGYLLDTIGHRSPALELMAHSVQVAREVGDSATLAHCLLRQANGLLYRAVEHSWERPADRFAEARDLYAEALPLAEQGQIRRAVLAGSARALAGCGTADQAEERAWEALRMSHEADDWTSATSANWALSGIRRDQGQLTAARTFASRALDGAERIRDTMLLMRFSLDLAVICKELGDPVGESAALRRTVLASGMAVEILQEGLGQALEQRKVAVQAQRLAAAAQEAALRDPLTGLTNRLGLEQRAPELLDRTASKGRLPWLVLVDVDWFKGVNDDAGHAAGDITLQEVAHLLRRECRSDDLICRWAGDEFVVLLADAADQTKNAGPVVAERIRAAVDGHDWQLVLGGTIQPPTVSIGVAAGPARLEHLFAAADTALYRAKRAGRNRVEIDQTEHDQQLRT